jgi:phosphoribosyl-dephospho-CoA transferase
MLDHWLASVGSHGSDGRTHDTAATTSPPEHFRQILMLLEDGERTFGRMWDLDLLSTIGSLRRTLPLPTLRKWCERHSASRVVQFASRV